MPQTRKAVTLDVDFGFATVEGLMLPNGDYAIAVSQVAALIGTSKNTASRDFKRLLGEGFRSSKVSTDQGNQRINALPLDVFVDLLYALAKQGDPAADALVRAFIHEAPQRRFDTAAGVKVSEAEYNAKLKQRMERVAARREWTDIIRDRSLELTGRPASERVYSWCTNRVNMALFGRPNFHGNRDNMNPREQRIITSFETMVAMFADRFPRATPTELVTRALDSWAGK